MNRLDTPRARRVLRRLFQTGLLAAVFAWLDLQLVPIPEELDRPPQPSLELVDRHGVSMREVRTQERFARPVSIDEIPLRLIHALLAAEDKRFLDHRGVDWLAVARSARDGLRHGKVVSGASTITQQLVKVADPRPRTFETKFIEAATALRLEEVWDKERILVEYFNRVDFGHLNVGIAAAADYYFGKPLSDLSDAEAALLAGLPKNPSRLSPHRALAAAQRRQRTVLERMRKNGWLNAAQFERAVAESPRIQPVPRTFRAPHFTDLVLRKLPAEATGNVRTTLDLALNERVERIVAEQMARLESRAVSDAAAVVIDNATGDILALVGSKDYSAPESGQVNGAWAPRSPGSTIKPFTYLLALEHGTNPATVVPDIPTAFPTAEGAFSPENYSRRCAGPVSYRTALANSLNIPAVRVLADLGGPAVLQERLTDLGLTTLTRTPSEYGLGLTIGNAETRLIELTNAYACLARLGEFKPWRLFPTDSKSEARSVFDARNAWLIADILSDNAARMPSFGAHSPLRFDFPVACKTGTSTDFRDNWAIGYTPEFTVGVWAGNFDGSAMRGVSGVDGAAPILHAIFEHLHTRHRLTWYPRPPGIVEGEVEPLTGHRLTAARAGSVREKFRADQLPAPESLPDYDDEGRVVLPEEYSGWFASAENSLRHRAVVAATGRLRILSPAPGTTFIIDPDLPTSGRLALTALGCEGVKWQSATLECRNSIAKLAVGEHRLMVIDPETGARAETWIRVISL
ncbi:MAG: penicillin-binding protein 1C [Chthoniobacteraceae bacterium]